MDDPEARASYMQAVLIRELRRLTEERRELEEAPGRLARREADESSDGRRSSAFGTS